METTKIKPNTFDKAKSTYFDDEALDFWGERARIQPAYMGAIASYLV